MLVGDDQTTSQQSNLFAATVQKLPLPVRLQDALSQVQGFQVAKCACDHLQVARGNGRLREIEMFDVGELPYDACSPCWRFQTLHAPASWQNPLAAHLVDRKGIDIQT